MSHLAPVYWMNPLRRYGRKRTLTSIWVRIALLLLAAVAGTLGLAYGHDPAGAFFQSPVSPPIESPVAQPPVEQPPVEPPAVEQAPAPQADTTQPPVEPAPPQQPVVDQAGAPATPLAPTPQPVPREREETFVDEPSPSGPANFILDQAELIDTVVVSGAYIWLCCGVGLFLLAPLVLLFVYIRGRSKIIREEGF